MTLVRLPFEPLPMPRPRAGQSGRGSGTHMFIPDPVRAYQTDLAWAMRAAQKRPLLGPCSLRCHFQRSTRRRVDIDNLVKAVQDAANGVLFEDDSQIRRLEAWLTFGSEPFVEVEVREL